MDEETLQTTEETMFTNDNYSSENNVIDKHTFTDAIINFNSNNDTKFYTLQGYEPSSVAEQELAYIIDTRNIIIIIGLSLICIRLYGLLKNALFNYFN